jgi:hypothetical protein
VGRVHYPVFLVTVDTEVAGVMAFFLFSFFFFLFSLFFGLLSPIGCSFLYNKKTACAAYLAAATLLKAFEKVCFIT